MSIRRCEFYSLEDQFNFGRYRGLSLADVLDINPSYLDWCVKHCTGMAFLLQSSVIEEMKLVYPNFCMDNLFYSRLEENFQFMEYGDDEDNCIEEFYDYYKDSSPTYEKYAGSWAQDVEGYSDDDIETIFDGDPSAYWNID